MAAIAPVGPTSPKPEDTAPVKPVQSPAAPAPNKAADSASISPQAKQLLAKDKDHDGDTDKAGVKDTEGAKQANTGKPPAGAPQGGVPASAANVDATTKRVSELRKQGMSVADIAKRIGKTEAQVKSMISASVH